MAATFQRDIGLWWLRLQRMNHKILNSFEELNFFKRWFYFEVLKKLTNLEPLDLIGQLLISFRTVSSCVQISKTLLVGHYSRDERAENGLKFVLATIAIIRRGRRDFQFEAFFKWRQLALDSKLVGNKKKRLVVKWMCALVFFQSVSNQTLWKKFGQFFICEEICASLYFIYYQQ